MKLLIWSQRLPACIACGCDSSPGTQCPRLLLPEHCSIHPLHHSACVGFTEMGVPLDHGQGLVPQRLSNFEETRAVHGEIGGCGVAQVVEPEILDSRSSYRSLPRSSDISWS